VLGKEVLGRIQYFLRTCLGITALGKEVLGDYSTW
jgi:hypothetical protein